MSMGKLIFFAVGYNLLKHLYLLISVLESLHSADSLLI